MPCLFRPTLMATAVAMVMSTAHAEIKLDNLVVSASGFEQKITEAPASISVVNREDLEKKRFNSLAQALEDIEGIDVRQGTGKTGGLNISMRGMPSEYTLILIDGRRQNASGNVTPNGFNETSTSFMPPLSAIERIEVIRGPMSTLYGSDAMGGVINIITRKVPTEWTGTMTVDHTIQENSDYGRTNNASVYLAGPLVEGLAGLQLSASGFKRAESDLQFDNNSEVSKRGASPVEGHNTNLGAKLTLTPHEDHDIALDFQRGRQWYNNDECQLGTLDGADRNCRLGSTTASGYLDYLRFERDQYALLHTGRFSLGTLESSIMHNKTRTLGRTLPGTIGADVGIPGHLGGDNRKLETTNLVFDTKFIAPIGEKHITTLGGQWMKADMTDGIALEDFEQKTWAVFLEDEWRLRDDLALTLGARYDHHEAFGGHVSPRAYLVWNTTDNWTMKGGVSRGYRAPDINDLHEGINGVTSQGEVITIGSPDLDPEITTTTEFGVYYDNFTNFNANATLFHNKFKDKIADGPEIPNCVVNNVAGCVNYGNAYTQDTFGQLINVDEAETQGLELAARWSFAPSWALSGNYTYTDSEQKSGPNKGRPLTNTPKHLANLTLDWQTTDRLGLWLKGEYRGKRTRFIDSYSNLSAADKAAHDASSDLKSYTLFHLGGSYRATENLTINAAVYNLFDKDFLDGKTYLTNTGDTGWISDYSQIGRSTTGSIEEGRRLWLSAVLEF